MFRVVRVQVLSRVRLQTNFNAWLSQNNWPRRKNEDLNGVIILRYNDEISIKGSMVDRAD